MLLQKRLKKVKPILVKKNPDKKSGVSNVESAPVENHFEEIHPKDEFELLRLTTVSHLCLIVFISACCLSAEFTGNWTLRHKSQLS